MAPQTRKFSDVHHIKGTCTLFWPIRGEGLDEDTESDTNSYIEDEEVHITEINGPPFIIPANHAVCINDAPSGFYLTIRMHGILTSTYSSLSLQSILGALNMNYGPLENLVGPVKNSLLVNDALEFEKIYEELHNIGFTNNFVYKINGHYVYSRLRPDYPAHASVIYNKQGHLCNNSELPNKLVHVGHDGNIAMFSYKCGNYTVEIRGVDYIHCAEVMMHHRYPGKRYRMPTMPHLVVGSDNWNVAFSYIMAFMANYDCGFRFFGWAK